MLQAEAAFLCSTDGSDSTPVWGILLAVGLMFAVGGCRSVVPVPPSASDPAGSESVPIEQRVVVIVHGDASYRYHEPDGTAHEADVETLKEAFRAARAMPQSEVFVFHQRPERRLLGLFPRDDGTAYHFRQGRLVRKETYEQERERPITVEAEFVREHGASVDSTVFTAALYYGHAVPERRRAGYHRSRPDAEFGIDALAQGLGRLGVGNRPLDALVLSTCDGGTPATVAAHAPYARSILAAPGDLHLSFIDVVLLPAAPLSSPGAWTQSVAERAFDRLADRTVTGVRLATYDTRRAGPAARRLARQAVPDTSASPTGAVLDDCRRVLGTAVDTAGVSVWYRSPRFGRSADRESHSGWGCVEE
jgi:hypothetical protein